MEQFALGSPPSFGLTAQANFKQFVKFPLMEKNATWARKELPNSQGCTALYLPRQDPQYQLQATT